MSTKLELAKAYIQIIPTYGEGGLNAAISKETNKEATTVGESAGRSIGSGITSGLGSMAATIGKAAAATIASVGALMAVELKKSVELYADYEQLTGGVETLFGNTYENVEEYVKGTGADMEYAEKTFVDYQKRQETVLKNASKAYKTAGLNANDYMETVTSFAAALNASLGEYSYQSAEYADMAISDMADNANKMGTAMESVQNAYMGFSKGNFTMLDNLKLGYGGTKTEMERLMRDAEKLGGYIEGSLSIDSFADVTEAIHIVQENMGITGTTAKEAGTTISGSMAMAKAAWDNLLIGMMDGEQDLGALVQDLMDSIFGDGSDTNKGILGNLIPRIVEGLPRMIEGFRILFSGLAEQIPGFIEVLLPSVISLSVDLINALVEALPGILAILVEQLPVLAEGIWTALKNIADVIWQQISEHFPELASSLGGEDGEGGVIGMLKTFWDVMENTVFPIIQDVAQWIWDNIPTVLSVFTEVWEAIAPVVQVAMETIGTLWETILKPVLDAIIEIIKKYLQPVVQNIAVVFTWVFKKIEEVVQKCSVFITPIIDSIGGTIEAVIGGIQTFIGWVKQAIDWATQWFTVDESVANDKTYQAAITAAYNAGMGGEFYLAPPMATGGILEQGQVGFLEGDGAEAVVPLDQNYKWIHSVAEDFRNELESFGSSGIDGLTVVLDSGELVGGISTKMDLALGRGSVLAGRGMA